MMNNQTSRALLALFTLTLIWGYNWVVVKSALPFIHVAYITAMRTALGAICLFALIFILKKPFKINYIKEIIWLGLLQTTGFTGFMMWALQHGGAGKSAVLTYTMPFWVMILAWIFLGEKLKGWQWPAAIFAATGMLLVINPWHFGADRWSVLLATLSGVCWAMSVIVAKKLHAKSPNMDLLTLAAWQMLFGALPILLISAWLIGFTEMPPIVWNRQVIFACFYNVLLSNALGWLLWLYAVQRLQAGVASMGSLLAPIIGVSAAWVQLGEIPTAQTLAGMGLILLSLVIISLITLKKSAIQN